MIPIKSFLLEAKEEVLFYIKGNSCTLCQLSYFDYQKQHFEFSVITSEGQLISERLNNTVTQLSCGQTGI